MKIFDAHISGSLSVSSSAEISNNLLVSGNLTVLGTVSGNISGSITNADTANKLAEKDVTEFATTGSNSFNGNQTVTGSIIATQISSSFTGSGAGLYGIPASGITGLNLSQIAEGSSTASISSTNGLRVNTNTEITGALTATGQISGSFKGDGTNLYNIPASGVTGLNLTRIADGAATASISNTNGFRINSNTEITGALKLNKVDLGTDDIVEITVTDSGGKFFINGVRNPKLEFIRGLKYKFLYSNFSQHPFKFSITDNGTHNGGTEYTTGVTMGYSPDYIQIEVTDSTPSTLHYFCGHHVGMGNSITIYSDFLHGQANIDLIKVDTGILATTGSNNFIGNEKISGSLAVTGSLGISGSLILTGSVDITGSMTLNGQPIGTGKLDESIFQSYTSSNDSKVSSLESSTGSLNTFTSSIDTTIKNKLNTETVISGSVQVLITGTTGYSTFSSSISTSIGSLSSSVATTTSGLSSSIGSLSSSVATTTSGLSSSVGSLSSSIATTTSDLKNRVDSIETSTGSLNSFTSSINTTIKTKLDSESVISGSIQVAITGTTGYSTFSSSIATTTFSLTSSIGSLSSSAATTTSGLSSSIGSLSSSVATTTSELSSSIGSLSSSVATTTLGLSSSLSSSIGSLSSSVATTTIGAKNQIDSIETSTGSLNSFTSSISTTIKDKLNSESVLSGSIQVNITGTTGYGTFSSSIATTTNDLSSSVAITTSGLTSTITSLSSSIATTTLGLSSSIGSLSSSVATTTLTTKNRVDSIESKTGSYATTGSNIFQGTQTITGSLYISQDLIVAGSSSIQNISSSIVNIADNIITVNALNPSVRFGGLAVIDSGSSPQVSGSMLFDSVNNQWIFVHQNQASVTSSVLLMGPETYDNLGNEGYLTLNRIPKGTGIEHLNDSNITDTGTLVSINSNTEITGTLNVTGNIINPNITAIQSSTGSLNTFTASLLSAIELTGSNLTVRGNLLVKGTTTNVNTSTLDVDNNLINLNGAGAANAGLRVKDTTGVSQLSGSLLWDATNDYWIAGQLGSEQRLVRETEFNNAVTRIGNVESSTGSLNSFTSSINTTIKSKLNTDGVISGSAQVNHNATSNYDANQHIDHTTVSISPGNGLSGGGTIATTRTLTLDTGSVHFLDGVKKELNTEGVLSGSIQVNHNATTNYVANQHIDHTTVSITAGSGLTGGGDISATRTINIGAGNGITVNADDIAIDTASATFTTGVKTKMNTDTVMSGSYLGTATTANLSENASYLYYTDARVKTKLNAEGVISGSAQVTGLSNAQLTNSSFYVGTTSISLGRASASQTLTGISIDGTSAYATQWGTGAGYANFSSTAISSGVGWVLGTTGNGYYAPVSLASVSSLLNLSGTNTGDETLARVNALAITTVGTITSGTWNGTAIGNTYLANSSFHVGTTSISLGRASASQTLTGISIDGNAGTVTNATFYRQFTVRDDRSDGSDYSLAARATGLYAINSTGTNGPGHGYLSLIHVANGNDVAFQIAGGYNSDAMYFRGTTALQNGTGYSSWRTVIHSGNIGSQTVSNVSGTVAIANGGTGATGAAGARTNLGLVIGTDVLAYRTFGTAAASATGDFATAAQGTTADAALARAGGTMTGNLLFNNKGIHMKRDTGANTGIGWYSTGYSAWTDYMSPAAATGCGPMGNITAPAGTYVTSWGLRRFIEDSAGYGWTWESGTSTQTTPTVKAELRSSDGLFSVAGAMYSAGSLVKTSANSSYSTSFSSVSSVTVTHSLGTKDVAVFVYDSSDNMFWPSSIVTTSTSVVTITFASSRSGRVVVVR